MPLKGLEEGEGFGGWLPEGGACRCLDPAPGTVVTAVPVIPGVRLVLK